MRQESNSSLSVPPLFIPLSELLTGDIDCSYETCTRYSTDGSAYAVKPQAVIHPKTTKDIRHVIAFSYEHNIPITPCGSGTSLTGGSLGEGIIIDMTKYFTTVSRFNTEENTVTVDAGVTIEELQSKLSLWNMEIPLFTYSTDKGTIGGMFATKSLTGTSFNVGTIREWVESVTIILDTGEEHIIKDGITPSGRLLGIYQEIFPYIAKQSPLLRALKPDNSDDATGYNVWGTAIGPRQLLDQLAGSEGTLGIITSITFRTAQKKVHSITTAIPFQDEQLLISCIEIAKHHRAQMIALYDESQVFLINKLHPELLPEKNSSARYTLLVTHSDNDVEELHIRIRTFTHALPVEKELLFTLEDETVKKLVSPEYTYTLLTEYARGSHVVLPVGCGIIVPLFSYSNLISDLEMYMSTTGKMYTLGGYAGSGHVSLMTLFDYTSNTYTEDVSTYTEDIFRIVKKHKGGVSACGGDGITRTPYLSTIYNETAVTIFSTIKKIWDPHELFNPGKKTAITRRYLQNHLSSAPYPTSI